MTTPAVGNRDASEVTFDRMMSTVEQALARELLQSQALRTLALGAMFGVASLFLCVLLYLIHDRYGWLDALSPLKVFGVVAGVALYELGMHRMIKEYARRGETVPVWIWYVNACIEISAMSTVILLVQGTLANPVYALTMPPLLAYFLFIILSTLYLNVRLSLFTSALAAIQYLAIVLFTFSQYAPDGSLDPLFLTPYIYIGKTVVLLLGGIGAGFVAQQLTLRLRLSLDAAEERNREHRANLLKSQFLADMSHEIRTPLNAIIGHAQLLETDPNLNAGQRRSVEALRVGGRHLLAIVNDVLDLSKIEAGNETATPAQFDLAALLRELTLIFSARTEEKGLNWVFSPPPRGLDVIGDEAKLRQVLTNILGNAVKFTASGQISLRVTNVGDDRYLFEIEDTGPGITEDRQEDIFDPFAQDEQGRIAGGTGLGLAIAHRYVTLMGGELAVSSRSGAGARFFFTIPLIPATTDDTGAVAGTPVLLVTGTTVDALVVDDLAENREVLSRILERAGVNVAQADDGPKALVLLGERPFDIAFLDIRMPGMDGVEIAHRLDNGTARDVKLVAVSASALAHERSAYLDAGFDDFLSKPVQMAAVYDCIARLLGVRFEARPPTPTRLLRTTPNLSSLPDELRRDLDAAARSHNITDLKRHIDRLESLGLAEAGVAARLRMLCASYDMAAVRNLLELADHE